MALLHPTEDIVFKLFFTRNPRLLCSLIEEVLRRPIASAAVQSAALELAFADDRGVLLDILVELPDGTRVNVEMQCDPRGFTPERWLYHWARIFAKGIERGDEFTDLTPVVCIVLSTPNAAAASTSTTRSAKSSDTRRSRTCWRST